MTRIDAKEAASALSDIASVAHRVRQSRVYQLSSLITIMWGVLVFAGNLATWAWPRDGGNIWIAVNVVGVAATLAIIASRHGRTSEGGFDVRMLLAYLLF